MEIKEKIDKFEELKSQIGEYFGMTIYDGFDDMRNVTLWSLDDSEIHWVQDGDEYGGEIYGTSIWEKKEYTLVRYDNGSGEKIYAIFDNKTRNDEYEY